MPSDLSANALMPQSFPHLPHLPCHLLMPKHPSIIHDLILHLCNLIAVVLCFQTFPMRTWEKRSAKPLRILNAGLKQEHTHQMPMEMRIQRTSHHESGQQAVTRVVTYGLWHAVKLNKSILLQWHTAGSPSSWTSSPSPKKPFQSLCMESPHLQPFMQ